MTRRSTAIIAALALVVGLVGTAARADAATVPSGFTVWVNGVKKFDSAKMIATSPTKPVVVNVAGGTQLKLVVTAAGDGNGCDHADWANARLG